MPGWGWALIVVAAVVLVAVPATLGVLLWAGGTDAPEPDAPATDVATTEAVPAPTSTAPDADDGTGADEGAGGFGDLLEGLLGGMDPVALAQCIGVPEGSPEPLPDDPEAAVDVIAEQVARERGLAFTDPVDPDLLEPAALADRVVELSAEDYPAEVADVDARLLAALGAIPEGTDLRELQLDLLGGQVAGFYDPDTGELTAVATDGLDPTARITLAHELDHALVDQAIGLPDLDGFAGRSDEALATLAVVEGDASLLMQRWSVAQLSILDQLAAAGASLGPADQLQSVPWVLQQQLVFPYTAGLELACEQFVDGGWDAVDALYATPPTTSAQVLWPERFAAGEAAVDVPDPQLPGDRWQEARRDQLGAADLLWLFQAPGDDRDAALRSPEDRARAWAGGELVVGTDGPDTAVAITLAEHADAPLPLCDSVVAWYAEAHPDAIRRTDDAGHTFLTRDTLAEVVCDGELVELVVRPADAVVD